MTEFPSPVFQPAPERGGQEAQGPYYTPAIEMGETSLLRAYWGVLAQHRFLIGLIFVAVVGVAAYAVFSTTPLYTAATTLRIDPQDPRIMQIEEVLSPQTMGVGQYDYYQTQFALLKSRSLAARVISDLGLAENVTFTGQGARPGVLKWLGTKFASMVRSGQNQDGATEKADDTALGVKAEFINRYLAHLEVMPVKGTRLVRIEFTSPEARLARDIANGHATTFLRMNLEARFELTGEAREFLEKKLTELAERVRQSEEALSQFRQKQQIVSLEGSENIVIDRMIDLNKRLTEAQAARIDAESLYRTIAGKNAQDLAQVVDNPVIQQLKGQVATLESEAARLSATFEPAYPRLVELNQQIQETRGRLSREVDTIVRRIKSDYTAARAREEGLGDEAERQKQAALNMKESSAGYVIFQQTVESNRALHDSVLKRLNETHVSGDLTMTNMQVTDRAETPLAPSYPKKAQVLLNAAFLGLLLGGGVAFVLEYLDSTVKTPRDAVLAVGAPNLGVVPHLSLLRRQGYGYGYRYGLRPKAPQDQLNHVDHKNGNALSQELMIAQHPLSIVSEAYRSLRTGLLLSRAEKPAQVILITSPQPGDGKTVTALNLALTLVQDGYSVLVLDADLRKGRCHKLLHRKNHNGLSHVLTGTLALQEAVQQTSVDGLWLLSRGVIPPNPVELLGAQKMKQVVGELREQFAFIVVDSPPVLGMSDAVVLSTVCDGVLLVVRGQETTSTAAAHAAEQLRVVQAKILGTILNAADIRNPDYSHYRYYYSSYYSSYHEKPDAEEEEQA